MTDFRHLAHVARRMTAREWAQSVTGGAALAVLGLVMFGGPV